MTFGYIDSSILVAVAFAEPGYEAVVTRLDQLDALYASNLVEAEVRSALNREGVADDGNLLARLSWVLPDRPLTAEMRIVLEAGHLRGADLWHLACALYLSPSPQDLAFLTLDDRQAALAATIGFPVFAEMAGSGG
jgi:predicted nucleic acid-binding protein